MRTFKIVEISETARERQVELYEGETPIRRYYQPNRDNRSDRDRNLLIPAMQQWGVLPKTDFEVFIEYLDGSSQLVSG